MSVYRERSIPVGISAYGDMEIRKSVSSYLQISYPKYLVSSPEILVSVFTEMLTYAKRVRLAHKKTPAPRLDVRQFYLVATSIL